MQVLRAALQTFAALADSIGIADLSRERTAGSASLKRAA